MTRFFDSPLCSTHMNGNVSRSNLSLPALFLVLACGSSASGSDSARSDATEDEDGGEGGSAEPDATTGSSDSSDTGGPAPVPPTSTETTDGASCVAETPAIDVPANNDFETTACLAGSTACSNCEDDDGDGLIDAFDPECTGPLDDDEATFATGIPGDNIDFCQDCFFDGNSGHEDDGCDYHTDCLYGMVPPPRGNSGCFSCETSAECQDNCLEYTPNGCDCFGCCEVFDRDGESRLVLLDSQCTVDDLSACQSCQQSADCRNDCDPCEICIGKTTVAPSCGDEPDDPDAPDAGQPPGDDPPDEGVPSCSDGRAACTEEMPCPSTDYCLTGCCVVRPMEAR